jgi:MFS family permease
MSLPLIFYVQLVRGLTPTQSALIMVPTAILALALAPVSGKLIDKYNPRWFAVAGVILLSVALFWYADLIGQQAAVLWLLLPAALVGLSSAFLWAPIANVTTRNLPPRQAGAGSGVYNTTRQVGSVLGSASIAALIQARLAAELPGGGGGGSASYSGQSLPDFLHAGFATAMAEAMLLPAAVVLIAAVAAAFFAKPEAQHGWGGTPEAERRAEPAAVAES